MRLKEKQFLRDLARRQAEIAALPIMEERRALWYGLNDGSPKRPLVTMEFHGVESDVYPPLACETPLARGMENQMARQIFKYEHYRDDRVIPNSYMVGIPNWFRPFGYSPKVADRQGMAYRYEHAVHDLEADFAVFKPSEFEVDTGLARANERKAQAEDIIGDILPVRLEFPGPSFCPGHILVQMMSLETMCLSILD